MLIRSTWTLTTNQTAVIPRSYCLELVKQLHQQMGLEIGTEQTPSTTFSGLLGHVTTSQDFYSFDPNEVYQLSLSGLTENSSKAIASLDLADSLEFLGAKFIISDRQNEVTSYEQLYTESVAEEPEPIRQFNLKFVSPTSFSSQGGSLPLPVPNLMLRSWLEKWNHFAPIYLGGNELVSYLSQAIKIKRHRLQTRNFQLNRGYVTGFTGNIDLQLPYKVEPLIANVAHLLIQYAAFSGTGMKTRLGMGQTITVANSQTSLKDRIWIAILQDIYSADINYFNLLIFQSTSNDLNGERGIRTPVRNKPEIVFETTAFNHSAISPESTSLFY